MNQHGVFQIQPPGARIEVIAGNQHPFIIDPHTFQVIAVIAILPQTYGQLAVADIILQSAEKASQIDFIQIGQGADNLKWLIFGDIEIVGRLIANDNLYLFAVAQQPDNIAYQNRWQIEIRRTERQLAFRTGHQMVDGLI